MPFQFTAADVAYLRSAEGVGALAVTADLPLTDRSFIADLDKVRKLFGEHAGALIETVRLRRRAQGRLIGSETWLFTDDSLQQATASVVGAHRAHRLSERVIHDVTCSIGADLAELTQTAAIAVGSDLDPVRLAMARHNVPQAHFVRADALRPVSRAAVVIADPARRTDGRRTHDPAKLVPPLPDLIATYSGRDLVVKCAPGLDFAALKWTGEVEIVSLDGGVREACLWSPGLATAGRRATVLTSAGQTVTITDADPDDIPERAPGRWIIDPDGAIVRAGLVRHYAARHGLWQLDPRIAYLTGDAIPAGERGFEVVAQARFSVKDLRRELSARDCGSLEILARGVPVDPDALRKQLKLTGRQPMSLVITRIGVTPTAFICGPAYLNANTSPN